jgi:arylformamidase
MAIYDITVPISERTPIYEGDPGAEVQPWKALAKGDVANVSLLRLGAHTGTHVDAPAHFIEGAPKIDRLPLAALIGKARVLRVPDHVIEITPDFIDACRLERVERVLFRTRNSAFWADSAGFRKDFTHLLPEAAQRLVELGVRLVGVDYLSVEKFHSPDHQTHLTLLSNGVVILEGLDLREIPPGEYELICLPLKIAMGAGDGAPARAVLRTLDAA